MTGGGREVNNEVLNTNALGFELETYAGVDELVDLPAPDPEVHLLNRISFGLANDATLTGPACERAIPPLREFTSRLVRAIKALPSNPHGRLELRLIGGPMHLGAMRNAG